MNYIKDIMKVRYNKKYNDPLPFNENSLLFKKKLKSNKLHDILYVIEHWNGININADNAFVSIVNELHNFSEKDQEIILNQSDNKLIPFLSESCIEQITENSIKEYSINENLLERLDKYRLYNRIDSNYNKLNEKLSFSKLIKESKFYMMDDDLKREFVDKLIQKIDENYSLENKYKYNITLESLLYGFNVNGYTNVDQNMLLEATSEYYTTNTDISISDIKTIIEGISLYSEESKSKMIALFESDKKDNIIKKPNSIEDLCKAYNTTQDKSASNLKNLFTKIYGKSLDDCITESDNALAVITTTVVSLGVAAINPVLGILAAFTQYLISRNITIDQCNTYISNLKKEKAKVERKIENSTKDTSKLEEYLDSIDNAIEKVSDHKYSLQSDKENDEDMDNEDLDDFYESSNIGLEYLLYMTEMFNDNDIDSLNILNNTINESGKLNLSILSESGNLMNTLKLVKEKLKNSMKTMSTKEKATCKQIDNRFEQFVRDLQRTMSLEKREKVIKGKVAPSLTNMVKLAVAGTIGAVYAPTITAIGLLGAYAISKKATIREKQYILDELNVQLKITERKINQAEMKGDDKALEELYRLQARLNNEYKRIKYNMRLYHEGGCVL